MSIKEKRKITRQQVYHSDGFIENMGQEKLTDASRLNHEPRAGTGNYSSLPPL